MHENIWEIFTKNCVFLSRNLIYVYVYACFLYKQRAFLAKHFISVLNSLNYVTYLGVQWDEDDY